MKNKRKSNTMVKQQTVKNKSNSLYLNLSISQSQRSSMVEQQTVALLNRVRFSALGKGDI